VLLTATLYGFLMFAAAVTTAHAVGKRSLASATLAALLIGISTLIRPTSLYLPTLIGGILLIRAAWRRDGRSAVVALLVATIGNGVIGAWVYRNGVVCGEYTLCAIPRYNLLASHAAGTLGRARGESRRLTRDVLCEKIGIDVMTLRFLPLTAEQERAVKKLAIETFRDHKAAFLQEHLIRSANTFCGPEKHILKVLGYRDISFGVHEPDHPVETNPSLLAWGLLLAQVPFLGAIYLGALWTLVQRVRGRPMPVIVWTCFGLAVYLIVLSSGVPGDPRLRWPVIPLLIVVAAAGLRRPSCSFPEPARDE
jgi:hypothetical protein